MQNEALLELKEKLEVQARQGISSATSEELYDKINNKEKLSIEEQIEYLKAKGVQFNYMTEADSMEYLRRNSYYYKVTAYRYNFSKDSNGKYINLDFCQLRDLAIIDMHLRYLLIKLSLDIEHSLKTLIIQYITEDPGEDGYSIIDEYNIYERNRYIGDENKYVHVKDKIIKEVRHERDYNYDSYIKGKFPIWKLIEMMSYGQLASFIRFYSEEGKYKSKSLSIAKDYLYYSKNIRDAAAHSRPLLLDITKENDFIPRIELNQYVQTKFLKKKRSTALLTNYRIHDLCSLIFLHDTYVKGKHVRKIRKKELLSTYKRALYKQELYHMNDQFNEAMFMLFGVIKKYNVKS